MAGTGGPYLREYGVLQLGVVSGWGADGGDVYAWGGAAEEVEGTGDGGSDAVGVWDEWGWEWMGVSEAADRLMERNMKRVFYWEFVHLYNYPESLVVSVEANDSQPRGVECLSFKIIIY